MTKSQVDSIVERLDRIEAHLSAVRVELAEARGAYRLAKFVIALLGLSGLGGLTAWLSNGK
jgi:hypothetical protein